MRPRSIALLAAAMAMVVASPLAADPFAWKTGPVKLQLGGYAQGDFRAFPNWDIDTEVAERADTAEIRRARIGLEGDWNRVSFEAMVDVATLANHTFKEDDREPGFRLRRDLKDLHATFALSRKFRVRVGHMKLPVSREYTTSAARIDFVERSLLGDRLAPGRDFGGVVYGTLGRGRELAYQAGVFAGDSHEDGPGAAGTTIVARLVGTVASGLEVGASFSQGEVEADPEDPVVEAQPKGVSGRSASGWTYFPRKQVNGVRRRMGLDAEWVKGRLTLKGEALRVSDERIGQGSILGDLPPVVALGWSTTASVRLAGRPKADLHLRYESLHFDDDGESAGFEGIGDRARNLRPADDRALSFGVAVWPRAWLRIVGTAVVDRYLDPLLAPESGRRGNYVTILGRLQLAFP